MFYIFHHIPKTAGVSLIAVLSKWLNVVLDYHVATDAVSLSEYASKRVDLSILRKTDVLCGHYNIAGHYLDVRYPDVESYQPRKIIYFRDPLATAFSGVRFGIKRGWWSESDAPKMFMQRIGYFSDMLQVSNDTYQQVLDKYWFVGITESMESSIAVMRRMVEAHGDVWEHLPSENLNSTSEIKVSIPSFLVDEFLEKNALDQLIYEYAVTKFCDLSSQYL